MGWVCGVELGGKWGGVDVAYCWGWVGWNGIGLVNEDNWFVGWWWKMSRVGWLKWLCGSGVSATEPTVQCSSKCQFQTNCSSNQSRETVPLKIIFTKIGAAM